MERGRAAVTDVERIDVLRKIVQGVDARCQQANGSTLPFMNVLTDAEVRILRALGRRYDAPVVRLLKKWEGRNKRDGGPRLFVDAPF
jgi:hypothetical protein